jgi:thiol-disulfide isomerase/thioredoxin
MAWCRAIVLRLTCVVIACVAFGRGAAMATDDPDPRALLRQSTEAIAAIKSVRYTAVREAAGELAGRTPEVRGSVLVEPAYPSEPTAWRLRIQGTRTDVNQAAGVEFLNVADGRRASTLRPNEKTLLEGPPEAVGDMLADGGQYLVSWLMRWPSMVDTLVLKQDMANLSYAGRRLVAGVPCDVVMVDLRQSERNEQSAWYALGVEDRLPRRVEVHYRTRAGDGFAILTISGLRVNEPTAPEDFAPPALPEGFERRPYTPRVQFATPDAMPAAILEPGQAAPAFALKDAKGREVSSTDLRGRVVLLEFWATWCGPCIRAMPAIQKLHEEFADQGLSVFGINVWDAQADPVKFKAERGFTYGLLLQGDSVAARFGVSGIPAFFLIGKDGVILHSASGFGPDTERAVRAKIQAALR